MSTYGHTISSHEPLLRAHLRLLVTLIDYRASLLLVLSMQIRLPSLLTSICFRILLHSNDMAEAAQPFNVNTLYNVHVVEKLIQLTLGSNMEIIAYSHWTEELT